MDKIQSLQSNTAVLFFKVVRHELVRGSFWLSVGAIGSSFIAFLTNLFLARNLSIAEYGVYASLLSFFTLATIPAKSITTVIVRIAGGYFAKKQQVKAAYLYRKLLFSIIILSVIVLAFLLLFSRILTEFLHIGNPLFASLIAIAVTFSYLGLVNQSYLLSQLRFSFITFVSIVSSFVRLVVAIALVYAGFKMFGPIFSIVTASFVTFILKAFPLAGLLRSKSEKPIEIPRGEILKYAFPSAIAILSLSSFISVDIILARHFLPSHEAGLYGGMSLIGKVIAYSTTPIVSVMFPIVVKRYEANQEFKRVLYLAIFLVAMPASIITFFYFLFPDFTIRLFLNNSEYLDKASILWLFGLFIFTHMVLNVFVNFFLSIKKTKVFIFVAIFALLQIMFISIFHESIFQILMISISLIFILLCLLFIYFLLRIKRIGG